MKTFLFVIDFIDDLPGQFRTTAIEKAKYHLRRGDHFIMT